jgi:hypothetical protein
VLPDKRIRQQHLTDHRVDYLMDLS